MSRILFAWELGANLGHITPLLVLAQVLRERGHEVVFALRDIRNCAALLEARGFPFLQAPIGSGRAKDIAADPASYPEMLLRYGFADPQGLLAAARAWRNLYATVAPDLIVFDHSPIALLAAHDIGLPRVLYGMGFVSPPRVSPMPSFRPWENIPAARLEASEARALEATNTALKALGAQPLGALHELFDVEEDILTPSQSSTTTKDGKAHAIGARSSATTKGPCPYGRKAKAKRYSSTSAPTPQPSSFSSPHCRKSLRACFGLLPACRRRPFNNCRRLQCACLQTLWTRSRLRPPRMPHFCTRGTALAPRCCWVVLPCFFFRSMWSKCSSLAT